MGSRLRVEHGYGIILIPAVEAAWPAEIRLEMDRGVVSAQAETHGKHMR
jgi:hypothetical protein